MEYPCPKVNRHERVAGPDLPPAYGGTISTVYLDALAAPFDARRWQEEFLTQWPPASPAHHSYFARMVHGPDYALQHAQIVGGCEGATIMTL